MELRLTECDVLAIWDKVVDSDSALRGAKARAVSCDSAEEFLADQYAQFAAGFVARMDNEQCDGCECQWCKEHNGGQYV